MKNYAWNLPLSEFQYLDGSELSLAPDLIDGLFQHFESFLPNDPLRKNRNILIIDYVASGSTLASALGYLNAFLDQKYGPLDQSHLSQRPFLEGLEMTDADLLGSERTFHPSIHHLVWMEQNSLLARNFEDRQFNRYAEYGPYYAESQGAPLLNEDYSLFRKKLKSLVRQAWKFYSPTTLRLMQKSSDGWRPLPTGRSIFKQPTAGKIDSV